MEVIAFYGEFLAANVAASITVPPPGSFPVSISLGISLHPN